MRKTYDKAFKARVAREAVRGEKTIQELGQINGVHPNLIAQWKKQILENAAKLFERPGKESEEEAKLEREQDQLAKQLGMRTIEVEFLKKNTGRSTLTSQRYRTEASKAVGKAPMPAFGCY